MENQSSYYKNLIKQVLESSESDTWKSAVTEWEIYDVEEDEKQLESCICGKENLRYLYTIRNKLNDNQLYPIGDKNVALFSTLASPHERLQIGGVETRLREIGKRADLNKVHPHKFRRTLATRAIDKGMPIEQVQHLLGHVKIDTTMHYAMVNQANVKNSHRKFIG